MLATTVAGWSVSSFSAADWQKSIAAAMFKSKVNQASDQLRVWLGHLVELRFESVQPFARSIALLMPQTEADQCSHGRQFSVAGGEHQLLLGFFQRRGPGGRFGR